MKTGVCIVECCDKSDPGSEGRILKEVFNLMEVDSKLVRVASINELFSAIKESSFKHIHISTHGVVTDEKRFRGWWTPDGCGTKKIVKELQFNLRCTAIVSTACRSGAGGFAKFVTEQWGSSYYIAPTGSPKFHNAALFSHIYYHKLFKTQRGVATAFSSYEENYKNPHGFKLYKRNIAAIKR